MRQLKLSNKCNHEMLINYGFKKYGMNYKMFIPLYQKNGETLIELEFLISSVDHYIGYDVIDKCNDTLYTAYYDSEYAAKSDVLDSVRVKIDEILSDMADQNIITKRCLKNAESSAI